MVDRQRVLVKIDELQGYLSELKSIVPATVDLYEHTTKRACERLLQLSIEATIDICKKLVIGNRLGVPQDEVDVFEKFKTVNILSSDLIIKLKKMRGLRNILVHEYTDLDDGQVFNAIANHISDFDDFIQEVLKHLAT